MSKLHRFSAGSIKPSGWILSYMERDMAHGFFFAFDKISATASQEVFKHKNRRSSEQYDDKKCWWSGEHEGYWMDGLVRYAFLTQNQDLINRVDAWVNDVLASTDKDPYIGMYAKKGKGSRYKHGDENGELWTQARVMSVLLAYYELTGKRKVLKKVITAVDLTLSKYAEKNPFKSKSIEGGVSHGIGFFEILEWLFRITNDRKYVRSAKKLYVDFCRTEVRDDDLQINKLIDTNAPLNQHGAHIAEGLFVLPWLTQFVKNPKYKEAEQALTEKLKFHMTPSQAMRCDENVRGIKGSAFEQYEFCSLVESILSYKNLLFQLSDMELGDRIESIVFNAAQGSRLADGTALSYLSSDERLAIDHERHGERETYDACHQAAACCVLNDGRLLPHFLDTMWMKTDESDLLALSFGPCVLETTIDECEIKIQEKTNYPFDDEVVFELNVSKPQRFNIFIRKPHGLQYLKYDMVVGMTVKDHGAYVQFSKLWDNGDTLKLKFNFEIEKLPISKDDGTVGHIIKRGPLLFVDEILYKKEIRKRHENSDFHQFTITENKEHQIKEMPEDVRLRVNKLKMQENPWQDSPLKLSVLNSNDQIINTLVPLGATVLRQLVF